MFDSVGRNTDLEANKRRAAAVVVLLVFGGALTGLGLAVAAWKATEAVIDMVMDDEELVELDIAEVTLDEELPPPPPPPPPPPSAAQQDEPDDEDDEPDEEVPKKKPSRAKALAPEQELHRDIVRKMGDTD